MLETVTTTDPRVDAYLGGLPPDQREILERIRRQVARLAPAAVETIAYGMPTFRLRDRFLLSYAGWKRHCAIYPVSDELLAAYADALRGYERSKRSLHFTSTQPLPPALLEDVVRARIASIKAADS
jgi:uncharacterized protein YdhG (YjbR/CyaY superfamily)